MSLYPSTTGKLQFWSPIGNVFWNAPNRSPMAAPLLNGDLAVRTPSRLLQIPIARTYNITTMTIPNQANPYTPDCPDCEHLMSNCVVVDVVFGEPEARMTGKTELGYVLRSIYNVYMGHGNVFQNSQGCRGNLVWGPIHLDCVGNEKNLHIHKSHLTNPKDL